MARAYGARSPRSDMTDVRPASRPATRRSQHPRCVMQILRTALRPLHARERVAEVCGCRPEEVERVAELLCANSGRERTAAIVLRGRLDPAHDRRADHPDRRDHPAIAARQHRPARRRHHGDARPLQHPGLDRHPDPLRPAARLPARSRPPTRGTTTLDAYVEHEGLPTGYWSNFREFIVSLLKA